ncbi:MAG: hypothetical protein IIZ91_04570, partial [Oscillospiraceae bacterium]|nr:hypothetical protein [Oscillospiraceae bacterium]
LTAKVDNPYLAFESTFCVQKITVKDAVPVTPTLWDFTILPTQKIDATGNMETNAPDGVFTEDEGAGWQQAYNKADFPDGAEFMASDGVVFEPFKGLKWTAMANNKMVFYRNYPADYGGKHLAFNKAAEVMIPAKAGQVIEMVVASSKNGGTTKKITSQDVVETFDDGGGIKIEFATAYEYQTVTLTAKVDNPYLAFESTFCVQKKKLFIFPKACVIMHLGENQCSHRTPKERSSSNEVYVYREKDPDVRRFKGVCREKDRQARPLL